MDKRMDKRLEAGEEFYERTVRVSKIGLGQIITEMQNLRQAHTIAQEAGTCAAKKRQEYRALLEEAVGMLEPDKGPWAQGWMARVKAALAA